MKVKIKRIDKELPLPIYETQGSVGFDFLCRENITIESGQTVLIPTNVIIETPEGYALFITPRSSTFRKYGLIIPNSPGIVDQDYCGADDEVLIQVYNLKSEPVEIKRGDKIAQGLFVRVDRAIWSEIEVIDKKTRGGFGSTDQ